MCLGSTNEILGLHLGRLLAGTACSNFYVVVSGNVEEYYRVRHPRAPSDGGKGGLFTRKVKMALNMIQNLQSSIEERWTR